MDNEDESMEEMIKLEEDLGDQVETKESSEEDRLTKKRRDSGTSKKGKKAPDSGDSETEEPKKRKKEVRKETKKEKKTKLSFTANILNVLTTKTFSNIPPNTKFLVRFSHNILKAGCKKLSMLEKAVFYVKNSGKYKGFTLHSLDSDNVCMINTQLACMMIWTEETLENYSFCIDIKSLASLLDSANSCSYVELSSSSMDDNLKGAMLDNSVNSRIIEFTIPFETHQEEVNIKDFVAEKSVEIGSSLLASFTKVWLFVIVNSLLPRCANQSEANTLPFRSGNQKRQTVSGLSSKASHTLLLPRSKSLTNTTSFTIQKQWKRQASVFLL